MTCNTCEITSKKEFISRPDEAKNSPKGSFLFHNRWLTSALPCSRAEWGTPLILDGSVAPCGMFFRCGWILENTDIGSLLDAPSLEVWTSQKDHFARSDTWCCGFQGLKFEQTLTWRDSAVNGERILTREADITLLLQGEYQLYWLYSTEPLLWSDWTNVKWDVLFWTLLKKTKIRYLQPSHNRPIALWKNGKKIPSRTQQMNGQYAREKTLTWQQKIVLLVSTTPPLINHNTTSSSIKSRSELYLSKKKNKW